MPVSDISMVGRQPPHMGLVARGFAALGDMAERAVSTVTGIAADAAQAPSRLGQAGALLTGDGQLGSLWEVMAPLVGLLLGAAGGALAVHRLLQPQRSALAAFRPASLASFALGLLRSLLVDVAPAATYAGLAAGGAFLLFWDRGLVFTGTETFQKVASLYLSWVGDGLPRLVLVVVGLVIGATSLYALTRIRPRFGGFAKLCHEL